MARTPVSSAALTGRRVSAAGGARSTATGVRPVDGAPEPVEHATEQTCTGADLQALTGGFDHVVWPDTDRLTERHRQRFALLKADDLRQQRLATSPDQQHVGDASARQEHAQEQPGHAHHAPDGPKCRRLRKPRT
jgi:hypothetical protein